MPLMLVGPSFPPTTSTLVDTWNKLEEFDLQSTNGIKKLPKSMANLPHTNCNINININIGGNRPLESITAN